MLVRFSCNAYAEVTLFAAPAKRFLQMMGFTQTIPGAIRAEDVATALTRLKAAVTQVEQDDENTEQVARDNLTWDEEDEAQQAQAVSLATRAVPLIKLLEAAKQANTYVMWQATA